MRIYLSGTMAGRFAGEVKAERAEATKVLAKYGIRAVDPAAAEEHLWGKGKSAKIQINMKRKIMEIMVWHDLFLIRRSDALIVLTGTTPSDGTWREMCYAEKIGIPVIVISPKRYTEELMGWTTVVVPKDHIFSDIYKAARFLHKRYAKEHETHIAYFNSAVKNANKSLKNHSRRKAATKYTKTRHA
jgi:nucleoside 2-deoxyribosyltransferase